MAYIGNGPGTIRQGRRAVYEFTSTANQTAFSGTDENGLTLDLLQANDNDVYLNGVRLIITDDYTISGDVLTLTSGAASGDKLIIMTQDEIANDASYSKAASDSRYINYDGDIVNGTIQMGGSGNNITFADNNKAVFGDDSDLQIYHSGTHSWITNTTGYLHINAANIELKNAADNETMLLATQNGAVKLSYDNSVKLATASTGIDVTGIVTATGNITAGSSTAGVVTVGSANGFEIQKSGVNGYINQSDNGPIIIRMGSTYSEKIRIDSSGNVGIGTSNPFTKFHAKDTGWSSGAPYGSVSLIEGNNVNDNNWGHLVITDTTTTNGSGGSIRFATGAANALNPFSGIQGTAEGASWGGIGFETRPQSGTATRRMTIDSTGNVGIGTSTPAHKLEVVGTTKAEQYLLDAVAKDISDTAVDVFIYDTRKDSDGGAWRKRTQHTSWYNETLNTATRGARKEFPAVAVIVAESTQVTIYDGDDPSLPMWMVFNLSGAVGSSSNMIPRGSSGNESSITSVASLNAKLIVGLKASSSVGEGPIEINFIPDFSRVYREVGSGFTGAIYDLPISGRNSNGTYKGDFDELAILEQAVNDVAMTVLPNAPIDSVTGLPVPTIAAATDGGVSVIKDDGSVVDITESSSSTNITANVEFLDNGQLVFRADGNTDFKWVGRVNLPADDINYSYQDESKMPYVMYSGGAGTARLMLTPPYPADASTATTAFTSYKDNVIAGTIKGFGQGTTDPTIDNTYNGNLVNYTSSSYNTGWMNGDIKLATLSDTDDTNLGTELVTNGTFTSNVTGWSTNPSVASWSSVNGQAVLVQDANSASYWAWQEVTVVAGKTYRVSIDVISKTNTSYFRVGNAGEGSSTYLTVNGIGTGTTTRTFTVPAGVTSVFINVGVTISGTIVFDNVSLKEDVADRSVNGNGLQVFGTITKTAVATGADLVGYSGFSSSNYLRQPYNPDLNFGTGSYSIMGWFKTDATDSLGYIASLGTSDNDESLTVYITRSNYGIYFDYGLSNQYSRLTQTSDRELVTDTNWHHFVCHVSAGGAPKIYVDGINKEVTVNANAPSSFTFDTDYVLNIGNGRGLDNNGPFGGSIALLRISTTVPSPAQVAKIYNDEKVLFQENAKATLYGSSDAVTALAYDDDTELLHVGTSAGRSVFQGLRRIDNTTDAVGAAISASNGMVAED